MIRVDCEQGTQAWIEARLGIPTASQFHRIVTKTGALSKSFEAYCCELLAEWMLGASLDPYVSEWMERGQQLEPQALAYYEMQRDCEVDRVGFCKLDDGTAGASPDGLVGTDGGLEIKCPGAAKHVHHMLYAPDTFKLQIQGGLWVCEREWWDLLSYNPELPPALVRFHRDESFIEKLSRGVAAFAEVMAEAKEQLRKQGYVEREELAS